jgi:hypothetical protein
MICDANENWWGRKDSNLRSHEAADLQSAPFATRDTSPSQIPSQTRPPEIADISLSMELKAEGFVEARAGAFMGEGRRQSQPKPMAKMPTFSELHQIALCRNP